MHAHSHAIDEVFFALCKGLDTPVALSAWLRYKHCKVQVLELTVSPSNYLTADSFGKDYLVKSFLSKFEALDVGIDTKLVALKSFTACEAECRLTNIRVSRSRSESIDSDVASQLYAAQRIIARVLGPLNPSSALLSPRWSSGATSSINRRDARVDRKILTLPITVTPRAYPYLVAEIHDDLHWSAALLGVMPEGDFSLLKSTFCLTSTNRVVTVPKSSKTDRIIAIEPTGNIFLQKSVGTFIRRRLKRITGVDLDDQTRNQKLAASARDRGLATLDLSSASDTISRELVHLLLPVDWANFLEDLRSPFGKLPNGDVIRFEKFSSMGNGFTFELETLIFFALAKACCLQLDVAQEDIADNLSVYGDDIIVPSCVYRQLVELFGWCGFSVNPEKSFHQGEFYESCGKHYFGNTDVTPLYQKESLGDLSTYIRLGNRLARHRYFSLFLRHAWSVCRRRGGGHDFCIPEGTEGDDGWVVSLDQFVGRSLATSMNYGFLTRTLRFSTTRVEMDHHACLAYKLRTNDGSDRSIWSPGVSTKATGHYLTSTRWKPSRRWISPEKVCPWESKRVLR